MNTGGTTKFRPDIEGLRALAILLVVGYHANIPGFSGGYVGVDIFFVLSGYLITSLLVTEIEETGRIDLVKFYSRRARRLLPAMFVMLILTIPIAAVIYAPYEQRVIANSAITTAAYVSNIYFAREATNYLGNTSETNPYLHTWSLSVEEQFYFLWPILVLFAFGVFRWQKSPKSRGRLFFWLGVLALLSFVLTLVLMQRNQPLAFFMTPARAWEFAAGAIVVLLPGRLNLTQGKEPRTGSEFPFWSWVAVVGIFMIVWFYDKKTTFPGFTALLPVIATMILLKAGEKGQSNFLYRILGSWPMQETGRISYSLYLWHWPVFVFFACINVDQSLTERLFLIFISFLCAELSYRIIEVPVKSHRLMTGKALNALSMAVVVTLTGVGVAYAWRVQVKQWEKLPNQIRFTKGKEDLAAVYANRCHADYPDININMSACLSGEKNASRTMVLFGDSHAAQWHPAFEQMAINDGWQLVSLTKSSCPPLDLLLFDKNLGRTYSECADWRQGVIEKIKEIKPDLVVTTSSHAYEISPSNWQEGFDKVVSALSAESQHVILLKDTPLLKLDALMILARRDWSSSFLQLDYDDQLINSGNSNKVYDVQKSVAKKYANVETWDINRSIFPDETAQLDDLVREKTFLYFDSNHLSASFSRTLAPELINRIKGIGFLKN